MTPIGPQNQDIAALNRSYLLLLKQFSSYPEGHLTTGASKKTLQQIGALTNEQIDQIATTMPLTAVGLRFHPEELLRITKARPEAAPAYTVSLLTTPRPSMS